MRSNLWLCIQNIPWWLMWIYGDQRLCQKLTETKWSCIDCSFDPHAHIQPIRIRREIVRMTVCDLSELHFVVKMDDVHPRSCSFLYRHRSPVIHHMHLSGFTTDFFIELFSKLLQQRWRVQRHFPLTRSAFKKISRLYVIILKRSCWFLLFLDQQFYQISCLSAALSHTDNVSEPSWVEQGLSLQTLVITQQRAETDATDCQRGKLLQFAFRNGL